MKKRVFIAIGLSASLQKEILEWETGLKHIPARWIAGKNLHITLVPPWYAEEDEIPKIKRILADVGRNIKPFRLDFKKVSFGPLPRTPRLIWAEGSASDELIRLKRLAESALKQNQEKRPFLPHLTLARFHQEDFNNFAVKTLNEKVDWTEKTGSFVLMESHTLPSGADYEILSEISFSGN